MVSYLAKTPKSGGRMPDSGVVFLQCVFAFLFDAVVVVVFHYFLQKRNFCPPRKRPHAVHGHPFGSATAGAEGRRKKQIPIHIGNLVRARLPGPFWPVTSYVFYKGLLQLESFN